MQVILDAGSSLDNSSKENLECGTNTFMNIFQYHTNMSSLRWLVGLWHVI